MPRPNNREEALKRLRETLASGKIILGAGAGMHQFHYTSYCAMKCEPDPCVPGIGLSAKFIEKGGADLIVLYNSGRFRMAGRGSLAGLMPYGDANAVVLEMVRPVPPAHRPFH